MLTVVHVCSINTIHTFMYVCHVHVCMYAYKMYSSMYDVRVCMLCHVLCMYIHHTYIHTYIHVICSYVCEDVCHVMYGSSMYVVHMCTYYMYVCMYVCMHLVCVQTFYKRIEA